MPLTGLEDPLWTGLTGEVELLELEFWAPLLGLVALVWMRELTGTATVLLVEEVWAPLTGLEELGEDAVCVEPLLLNRLGDDAVLLKL